MMAVSNNLHPIPVDYYALFNGMTKAGLQRKPIGGFVISILYVNTDRATVNQNETLRFFEY